MMRASDPRFDEHLYREFLRCDRVVDFEALHTRLAASVLQMARRIAGNYADADELAQSLWVLLLERRPPHAGVGDLSAWLRGILRNLWRAEQRRRRRAPQSSDAGIRTWNAWPQLVAGNTPSEKAASSETCEQLRDAVRQLPSHYRDVVTLRVLEGVPPSQIASRLGRSRETVATQLRRGIERLRRGLPQSLRAMTAMLAWALGKRVNAQGARAEGRLRATIAITTLAVVSVSCWWFLGRQMSAPRPVSTNQAAVPSSSEPHQRRAANVASRVAVAPDVAAATGLVTHRLRVRDRSGAPVVGLSLRLFDQGTWPCDAFDPWWPYNGRTDAAGRIAFPLTQPGPVAVAFDGGSAKSAVMQADGTEHELVVDSVLEVHGIITDRFGHPVEDAKIWATCDRFSGTALVIAESDCVGRYRARLANWTRLVAWSQKSGFANSAIATMPCVSGMCEQDFHLEAGEYELRGAVRVVANADHPQVELASTRVYAVANDDRYAVEHVANCDEQGAFCFPELRRGAYTLACVGPNEELLLECATVPGPDAILDLKASASVHGHLRATGYPLDEVLVGVHPTLHPGTNRIALRRLVRSVAPDQDGRFLLENGGNGDLTAFVMHRGTILLTDRLEAEAATSVEWQPSIASMRTVTVQVPHSSEYPVLHVLLAPPSSVPWLAVPISMAVRAGDSVQVPLRSEGDYRITLTDTAQNPFRMPWQLIDRQAIELELPSTTCRLIGYVAGMVDQCTIELRRSDAGAVRTCRPRRGVYEFEELGAGIYEVRLRHPDGSSIGIARTTVHAGVSAIEVPDFIPPPLSGISIEANHRSGLFHLQLYESGRDHHVAARRSWKGSLAMRCFAGRYRLRVVGPSLQPFDREIVVSPDRPRTVSLAQGMATNVDMLLDFAQLQAPLMTSELHTTIEGEQGWSFDFRHSVSRETSDVMMLLGLDPGRYCMTLRTSWDQCGVTEFEVRPGVETPRVVVSAR